MILIVIKGSYWFSTIKSLMELKSLSSKSLISRWFTLSVCSIVILEKAMAPHSSTLAWKIPWMKEPGELLFMGSHRVGHVWSDLAAAAVIVICQLKYRWSQITKNLQLSVKIQIEARLQEVETYNFYTQYPSGKITYFVFLYTLYVGNDRILEGKIILDKDCHKHF